MAVVRWSMTTGEDGTGYMSVPLPPGCTRIVAASADVLAASATGHHDVDVDQAAASGPRDASGVVCQPCVGDVPPPAAGHQTLRLVGGGNEHFYTGTAVCA